MVMAKALSFIASNKKYLGYGAAVITALVSIYQLHDHVYDSGYEAAKIHFVAEQNKALEDARKKYELDIKQAINRLNQDHADELNRVRNEREIITKVETVTKYVDKEIIVQAECNKLAADVVGVLSQATAIISSSSANN